MTDTFEQFYEKKGIKIQKSPAYSEKDTELLANADAEEIIRGGFEDVVEEADRLRDIGAENMTPREKAVFVALTNHIRDTETGRELSKIGVTEDVYGSPDFQKFRSKFTASTPVREIYDLYAKTQPKKEIQTMGSMKSNTPKDTGVKDFYTVEEARKFTKADYDKNPALFAAVQKSMTKW